MVVKQVVQLLYSMAAVVSIISGRGLNIDVHCRNQINSGKLVVYLAVVLIWQFDKSCK